LDKTSAGDFERLAAAMKVFAAAVPERTTIRQSLALLLVCYASAMGRSITLSDIQDLAGEDLEGRPLIGQTIERTLDTFRVPTHRTPNALGWVTTEEDPLDRRRKYLKLTAEGISAANELITALRTVTGDEE